MPFENEFKINEYITLKLESGRTNIYVKGELFQQCKFLLLNIPTEKIRDLDEIDSIDAAAQMLGWTEEGQLNVEYVIPPETEFWGHCSNLQVWYENNYDTRLIHSNLAFPLLKRLVEEGDVNAKRVFREEIVKRYIKGNETVQTYLMQENFLTFLKDEELKQLIMELFARENIYGLDILGINMVRRIKFNDEEVVDLIFDSNYEIKNWVNNFLKESPNTRLIIIRLLLPLYTTNFMDLYKRGFKKCFFYADNIEKLDFMRISTLQIFDAEERENFFNVLDFELIDDYPTKEALSKLRVLTSYGSADAKQLLNDKIKKFFNDRNGDMIRHVVDREHIKYFEPNELELLLENFDYTIITEHEPQDLNYDESSTRIEILGKFGYSKANLIFKEEFFKKFKEDQLKGVEFLGRYLSDLKKTELEDFLKNLDYNTILNQHDPHTFSKLSGLEKLGISKAKKLFNQIYGPRSLVNFFSTKEIPYEKKLNLLRCILVPTEFAFLQELQSLIDEKIQFYIDPRISTSPSIVIKQKRISQIRMERQNIKELPKSLGNLNSLKVLNLNYNRLKNLPEEIGELFLLEKLLLKENSITELPKTVGKLTHLRHLDLTRNKLDSLPRSIARLKSLKYLNLNFNDFQNIPKIIGKLESLKYLFYDYNQLKYLPNVFHKLRTLRRIDLQGNRLKTIPLPLLHLNSIKKISLSKEYLDRKTLNLLEPIKKEYNLNKKSVEKPLNILFDKYIFRFYYEFGGLEPNIFWIANDEAKIKYGYPAILYALPLSSDIIDKFRYLYEKWYSFHDERYRLKELKNEDEIKEFKEFKNETRDTFLKAIKQLGPNFHVKFQMEGYGLPYEK